MGGSPSASASPSTTETVDVLLLGTGWTGQYLATELANSNLTHRSTSRAGSPTTIPFAFDPTATSPEPYTRLPSAKTIVIIFPVVGPGAHAHLIKMYSMTHPGSDTRWVQLGSTSAFDVSPLLQDQATQLNREQAPGEQEATSLWRDRHSPVDISKDRVAAEEELLALEGAKACVLNLAGLWGGTRDMRRYVRRVAPTKEVLREKRGLHMIHGRDVARGLVAVHGDFKGGRWLLTDMRVYDWWELASAWGSEGAWEEAAWVREFMAEKGLRALPRSPEEMGGRALDSREFWDAYPGLKGPVLARLEKECGGE